MTPLGGGEDVCWYELYGLASRENFTLQQLTYHMIPSIADIRIILELCLELSESPPRESWIVCW